MLSRAALAAPLFATTLAAGSWRYANESAFEGQQSFGLGFVSKTTGVVAGQLAIGSALWVTSDGAATFKPVDWTPFEFTDTAATQTGLVACGDLFTGVLYSRDLGRTWNASAGDGQGIQGCTSVRRAAFDAHGVAVVGQLGFDNVNALAVSTDDGISFERHDASAALVNVGAGYAALPNASTWFVTGADVDANGNPTAGQIAVTRNSGKSFERVFTAPAGTAVFGIDCRSGDECCALTSTGTKAEIICTADSGKKWNVSYTKVGGANTYLNDIRFEKVSDAYWAVGGVFGDVAWVLKSSANFKTFAIDTTFAKSYGAAIEVAADGSGAMFGIVFETDPNDDSNDNYIITNLPKGAPVPPLRPAGSRLRASAARL
jgi:hypothetical protein